MKVAIVGAGFTGLAAALNLAKQGVEVTVYEKEKRPGGLAIGFRDPSWDWAIEKHYHHVFTSDRDVLDISNESEVKNFFSRPISSTLRDGKIIQLDSPLSLLKFGGLPLTSRVKTGLGLAYLKFFADWKTLEKLTAEEWLNRLDRKSYSTLWEPLLKAKFGEYAGDISAAWFWARIKKRSTSLGYFEGGFDNLALKIEEKCRQYGVDFVYDVSVSRIRQTTGKWMIDIDGQKSGKTFEKVLFTGPSTLLSKLAQGLPETYVRKLKDFTGIGAVNLLIALRRQFFSDNTYWLNINDPGFPFLAAVEHTNFVSNKHYAGDHLLYVGNYLPHTHSYFNLSEKQIFDIYFPFLQKINPKFNKKDVRSMWLFRAPFAQPVVTINYSKKILPFKTPLKGLFWASIQQVYPWDRGTNYAVEMGRQVSGEILSE
jgi:protoporphyrinogen oxidase